MDWRKSLSEQLRGRAGERGQAIVMVALALVGLIGMVGLAIDVGIVMSARRELVRVSDAAALAAAKPLSADPSVLMSTRQDRARMKAVEYAILHGFTPDNPLTSGAECTPDGSPLNNKLCVSFPSSSPARKLVRVEAKRNVQVAFMKMFGFDKVMISSGGRTGEAAPLDIVIVQDISTSQFQGTYCIKPPADDGKLISKNYTGYKDDCSTIPGAYKTAYPMVRAGLTGKNTYDPTHATVLPDWSNLPALQPADLALLNVPWDPFWQEQDAAAYFVDKLDPTYDQVGLASFESSGHQDQGLTNSPTTIKNRIGLSPFSNGSVGRNGLVPTGGTNIAAGLQAGISVLTGAGSRVNAVGAMILLTDGCTTTKLDGTVLGDCSNQSSLTGARDDALAQAQDAANKGIIIYTIYFGDSSWETQNALLMQAIADKTDNRRLDMSYPCSVGTSFSCYQPAFSLPALRTNGVDNYFRASNNAELRAVYDQIFEKIFTRLVN